MYKAYQAFVLVSEMLGLPPLLGFVLGVVAFVFVLWVRRKIDEELSLF